MSNLVSYHPSSPDPVLPGCINSGKIEDGVVFHSILPLEPNAAYCYIGRSSIVEAVALLFDMSVKEVEAALTDGTAKSQKLIAQLENDLHDVSEAYVTLKNNLIALGGDDVR